MGRRKGSIGIALVTGAVLMGASACGGGSGNGSNTVGGDAKAPGKSAPSASASPTKPAGPPMLLDTITPQSGTTVGVAMPISVVFTDPVAAKARATVEKHMKVSTSTPVAGAWHWFGDKRADWRPKTFWPSGTKLKIDADREGVSNGALVRTLSINAGSPQYPTWNGIMAVIDKQEKVHMTSCSVGISCDKGSPNYYDLTLPWDVHLTQSGTYVHYSTGDPTPGGGSARGSHGCVHLSLSDAKWFYGQVKQGDPVTITGSSRAKADPDNGYADFNLDWPQWLAGSASGEGTTSAL